jgi:hypothetical protein
MSDHGIQTSRAPTNEDSHQPITLFDATQPREPESGEGSRGNSQSPSWRQLAKRPTKLSVREGLARWKYSKWQQDRYTPDRDLESQGERIWDPTKPRKETPQIQPGKVDNTQTEASDFALRAGSQDRGRKRGKKSQEAYKAKAEKQLYEIDVLYENQRGWFFFGIPLYSHSSLLNFDPSPWMTKDGKDSAVNITNAQVPDPSWEWEWKYWYVDMSHDVDEEGWQYSFSFSRKFSWHGTHPWFHCFVRRRRWLRKRVKREMRKNDQSMIPVGHTLTGDYFTIHTRGRSPGSGLENTTTRGSSHMSRGNAEDMNLPPEEIKDIPSLMKALRLATIDREKIDAVKRFVTTGREELVYLEEHIPDVFDLFVFQASRRQLLEYLAKAATDAENENHSSKLEEQRANGLHGAVTAAKRQIGGLEYWSDRQHVLKTTDGIGHDHKSMFSESSTTTIPKENNPADVIKGISGKAEIGIDPTRKVLSPPPTNRVPASYDDQAGQDYRRSEVEEVPNRKKAEQDPSGTTNDQDIKEGDQTPRSLPPDSIRVAD